MRFQWSGRINLLPFKVSANLPMEQVPYSHYFRSGHILALTTTDGAPFISKPLLVGGCVQQPQATLPGQRGPGTAQFGGTFSSQAWTFLPL